MRTFLIPSLLFILSSQAFALDSFSILRPLGTNGDQGTESLELICVKDACQISTLRNDKITNKKGIMRSEANTFFQSAKSTLTASSSPKTEDSNLHSPAIELELNNAVLKSQTLSPSILALEGKLKARLRN